MKTKRYKFKVKLTPHSVKGEYFLTIHSPPDVTTFWLRRSELLLLKRALKDIR